MLTLTNKVSGPDDETSPGPGPEVRTARMESACWREHPECLANQRKSRPEHQKKMTIQIRLYAIQLGAKAAYALCCSPCACGLNLKLRDFVCHLKQAKRKSFMSVSRLERRAADDECFPLPRLGDPSERRKTKAPEPESRRPTIRWEMAPHAHAKFLSR